MARIAGVDLPRSKAMGIALTYIYGIGKTTASNILTEANIPWNLSSDDLTEQHVSKIREILERSVQVEGELRKNISMNIKRLVDMGSYRGTRHRRSLPARGQRTHSNARTKKGPRVAIAGKKSIKAMK